MISCLELVKEKIMGWLSGISDTASVLLIAQRAGG